MTRRGRRSWLTGSLLCGGVVGLAAGCGLPGATPASPPQAPASATYGGVLRVGISVPGGIDPIDAYEPNGELISATMCDTLLALDPDTGQLRDAIADGASATGSEFTVKLRSGVTFTNGKPFTASDVNNSLENLVATDNASYVAGYADDLAGAAMAASSTSVLASTATKHASIATRIGSHAVQLQTVEPDGGILRTLTEPALAPISQAAVTANPTGLADDPVCVGPYKLAAPYTPGAHEIRLIRYAGYYDKNVAYTGGGKGYPAEIDFHLYPTDAAAVTAYLDDQVDVVRVPDSQLSRVTKTPAAADLVYGPATAAEYLGLPDGQDGPLAEPDVRVALSEALNRTLLARTIYGPSAIAANGFEPSVLAIASGPSLTSTTVRGAPLQTCGTLTPATPDLPAARALLAKAATPLTGTLTLTVNNDAPYPAVAREVAREWGALGVHVNVVTVPWTTYVNEATTGGFTSAFRIRWSTTGVSPVPVDNDQESYLVPLLDSADTDDANWAHWTNNDFDYDVVATAAPLTNVQERGIAFANLMKSVCTQMPIIPTVFDRPAYLIRSEVVGAARTDPIGRDGLVLLRELYLKP